MSTAFHVSDVLTATTGRLYSLRGMEGVYDIMSHLAGESLFTHALVRAFKIYSPVLTEKFPELAATVAPDVSTKEQLQGFIDTVIEKHGEFIVVESMPELWESKNPVSELAEMWADKK